MLDAKIASALNKIIQKSQFQKKVGLEEQKAQKDDWFPRGKQIAFMICEYFQVTGAHDAVLDYADLFSVTLSGDDIQEFDARWDEVLLSMSKFPSDEILESLYKLRIRESDQLKKKYWNCTTWKFIRKCRCPTYQKLKTMVKRSIDQKLRLRNFDHGRIESAAVVKNWKGIIGVKGGKGISYQWKEKGQCSQGDRCSFRHETRDGAQKPEHTAATPSEPALSRGRSVSKKRSIRGKSDYGSIRRQTCRYYLKGTCTWTPCEYRHPPECLFFFQKKKQKTGCKSGDTCLCPHFNVDEQPNRRPKKGYPKRRESEDKSAVAIVKSVSQLGLCITRLRCTPTLRHASIGDRKGPSLGKIQVKPRHQRSHNATKFEDRSHEETERQERCAQSKAWDLAKNIYKLKANDKATFFSPAKRVLTIASARESVEREREFGSWFRGEYAYGQWERPSLVWVGEHEDNKESDDGNDCQLRSANE